MDRRRSSTVSVDVLTLRYNNADRRVEIAVFNRETEPSLGQRALPGVVLREDERLVDAARRAVDTKLGMPLRAQGQLTVFDEPHRDPRGATLSVAMWGVADEPEADKKARGDKKVQAERAQAQPTPGDEPDAGQRVRWFPLDDLPPLAFDHNHIIAACRPLLVEKLWRDLSFTRALTGPTFPVSAAVAITRSLTGTSPDRGNLNRRLASVKGLGVSHRKVVLGRGRPGTLWEWQQATVASPAE